MKDKIDIIFEVVCEHFNQPHIRVMSKRRYRELVNCRSHICWMARKYTNMSLSEIGQYLGGMDHATVMHNKRILDNLLDIYPDSRDEFMRVDLKVRQALMGRQTELRLKTYETCAQL